MGSGPANRSFLLQVNYSAKIGSMKTLFNRFTSGDMPLVFKALMLTVFPLGSLHLFISNIYAFTTGDWDQLNYFHILAIDLVFPELGHGVVNFWISQVCWLVFFFWLWYLYRQSKKRVINE